MTDRKGWHIEKGVPLAVIITTATGLILQTVAISWWAATVSTRVENVEQQVKAAAPQAERITRLEVKVDVVQAGINEIKQLVTQLQAAGRR